MKSFFIALIISLVCINCSWGNISLTNLRVEYMGFDMVSETIACPASTTEQ